jgi:hypothetical protein
MFKYLFEMHRRQDHDFQTKMGIRYRYCVVCSMLVPVGVYSLVFLLWRAEPAGFLG